MKSNCGHLCVVEEDGPILLAVLGLDDGVGLHGEVVQTVVVGKVVQHASFVPWTETE